MARDEPDPQIGAGHASAMFRQGLAELRAALYPESNVAQPVQHGMAGTLTQGEIADAKKPDDRDLNEEPRSILGERMEQAEHARDVREPEPPAMEKE